MLEPGSLLVLYSDGLVERRGERLGIGLERLEQAGRVARSGVPVDEVCEPPRRGARSRGVAR